MRNWNEKLLKAVKEKSFFCIKRCLSNGADIHYKDDYVIKHLSKYDCLNILEYLFQNYRFSNYSITRSLNNSIMNNRIENLKIFINNGGNINYISEFDFTYIFVYKFYDIITLLLNNGVNIPEYISDETKKLYLNYLRNNKLKNIYESNK